MRELDRDHRVVRPVADRDRRERAGVVELPAVDDGDEARERDDRRRARAAAPEADREAHHRALREAAEHDPLVRQRVDEPGRGGEALGERRRVREADARHRVPVRAAGRQRQRPARAVAVEPPLRVERVEQRQQVVLVRAAAVEEDERAVAARRPPRAARRTSHPRGPRARQRREPRLELRRGAARSAGGSESRSPSVSSGSSVVKPGPIVAISNRTPLGSRK